MLSPSRRTCRSVAVSPFSWSRDWNCSEEVTETPPHLTMMSPVRRPQSSAGVPDSGAFTTITPRANSLMPTVWPTGTSMRADAVRSVPSAVTPAAFAGTAAHSSSARTSAAPPRSACFAF